MDLGEERRNATTVSMRTPQGRGQWYNLNSDMKLRSAPARAASHVPRPAFRPVCMSGP